MSVLADPTNDDTQVDDQGGCDAVRGPARRLREELIDEEFLDTLMARAGERGVALTGEGGFLPELVKAVLERGLDAELTSHLGYERGERVSGEARNARNGTSPKTVATEVGDVPLDVPRDRASTFGPVLVPKGQRRLGGLDEMIISLYAGGMTVRDIAFHLESTLGTELSHETISKITDAVPGGVKAWQSRPLEESKVMMVLHAFTIDDSTLSLAELVRRTSIPKGTLHRVLADMVAVRMLDRIGAGYRLGGDLFELGMRASVERSLLEVAIPFMEDLYVRTHETVHLGVLDGTEVVYLSKIGGHRQASAPSRIGGRMPVHCTAIGKVLLAHADNALREQVLSAPLVRYTPRTIILPGPLDIQLDRIAAEGVAYEYEESATGIVCVAAPVHESEDVVAAISVTGPSHRFRPDTHAASVRAAAEGVGVTLTRRNRLLDR